MWSAARPRGEMQDTREHEMVFLLPAVMLVLGVLVPPVLPAETGSDPLDGEARSLPRVRPLIFEGRRAGDPRGSGTAVVDSRRVPEAPGWDRPGAW